VGKRVKDGIAAGGKNVKVGGLFMGETNDVFSRSEPGRDAGGRLGWRVATLADGPEVLAWMEAFYAEERLGFDGATQGRALDALLADPGLGAVFLLEAEGVGGGSAGGVGAGYVVLTRGHSLEFGGRFYLLDELYLAPVWRGRGEGGAVVRRAAEWAREQGAGALRLEVARENGRARATYARAGLVAEARELMTLRLG
jgi:GNAT superfamily N-acetyltransferase